VNVSDPQASLPELCDLFEKDEQITNLSKEQDRPLDNLKKFIEIKMTNDVNSSIASIA